MSEKRRDNKNRVLRNGESQRKDGRYMYKYVDNAGNVKYVYSWKLVKTDTVPQGAKDDIPLRDKEKQWTIVNKKDTIFKYIFWERLDSLPIPECCFHFIWC